MNNTQTVVQSWAASAKCRTCLEKRNFENQFSDFNEDGF